MLSALEVDEQEED